MGNPLPLWEVAIEVVLPLIFLGLPPLTGLLGGSSPPPAGWAPAAPAVNGAITVDVVSARPVIIGGAAGIGRDRRTRVRPRRHPGRLDRLTHRPLRSLVMNRPVIAGTDGSPAASEAVRWAAR